MARITDDAGTVAKSMTYDSFGNIVREGGSSSGEQVSYTGRERESEFGLYYYRSRYYDPMTGRFMSRDPLGFAAGDVNLYRYVGNNPVNWRDPFGLWSLSIGYAWGWGGVATFGSHNGTHFFNVTGLFGYGATLNFNPFGEPPSHLDLNRCAGESQALAGGVGYKVGASIGFLGLADAGIENAGYGIIGAVEANGELEGIGGSGDGVFGGRPGMVYQETTTSLGFGPFNRSWGFSIFGTLGFNVGYSWR